jgi:hypothetical protein
MNLDHHNQMNKYYYIFKIFFLLMVLLVYFMLTFTYLFIFVIFYLLEILIILVIVVDVNFIVIDLIWKVVSAFFNDVPARNLLIFIVNFYDLLSLTCF